MNLLCPCGNDFDPAIWGENIQILCDRCTRQHLSEKADSAHAWVSDTNILFGFATGGRPLPGARGTASGLIGGEVGGVTPVPLLSPFAHGARRG